MFRLDRNTIKKKKYGTFATKEGEVVKCSLFEGNHDLDDCNSFLQFDLQERSKWFFHNKFCYGCLSAISVNHDARTERTERNAKFVRKDPQPLCMVIKQTKVRLSSCIVTL